MQRTRPDAHMVADTALVTRERGGAPTTATGRIMIVVGTLNVGGAENHIRQVAPRLNARGFKVGVATLTERGVLADGLESEGVPVFAPPRVRWPTLNPAWWGRVLRSGFVVLRLVTVSLWLWRLLRRERPEIVHAFLPEAYVLGGLVATLAGVPVRLMSRRSLDDYQRRRPLLARIERRLHRRMTGFTGNSAAVVRQLAAEVDGTGAAPRLIHNGIDDAPFAAAAGRREATRRALAVPGDALVFVIVANLIPYKGHADLIAALGAIRDALPTPWRLLCAGRDDGLRRGLERLCAEAGIAGNVLWLGARDDVPDLLAAADIGVLCSHEEGFANAILESMAAGLPMVVTDVGGSAEAVAAGETGLVVPARDPAALAAALAALAACPAKRQAFGRAGRRRFEERFRIDRCVDAYAAWYRELLAARVAGPG